MRNLILFVCIVFLGGCVIKNTSYIELKPFTKMTSPYLEIKSPSSYPQTPFEAWTVYSKDGTIQLFRTIPDIMRQDINIRVSDIPKEELNTGLNYKLLNKEFVHNLDEYLHNLPLTSKEITNHKERGVNYYKEYVSFIGGLKCVTYVDSQNIAAGIGTKSYQSNCNYYDKRGITKEIGLYYDFYFTFNSTKFEGSNNPSLRSYKFKEIQLQFKKDMKEIFDSMIIYDMDVERMKKEELLYDKKYELNDESKAKDKSMKCIMIRHKDYRDDYWICEGKETNRRCTNNRWLKGEWKCEEKKPKNLRLK